MMLDDLKQRVLQRAIDSPEHYFHYPSGTHILYASWMVPFGARGCGHFVDVAHVQYIDDVNRMLREASERDLRLWLSVGNPLEKK